MAQLNLVLDSHIELGTTKLKNATDRFQLDRNQVKKINVKNDMINRGMISNQRQKSPFQNKSTLKILLNQTNIKSQSPGNRNFI